MHERFIDDDAPAAHAKASSKHTEAGWIVIGVGSSIAAANMAMGIAMLANDPHTDDVRVGAAGLIAGLTGLATSLIIGGLLL